MREPFICDECGRPGRYSGVGTICTSCEADYQQGAQDVEREKYNVMIGGEAYAAQEELAHYLRYGDDY